MTLRNRLLSTFLPLIIVPLIAGLILQFFVTRNYLISSEQDLISLEAHLLRTELKSGYGRLEGLGIAQVPFYRQRMIDDLQNRFSNDELSQRGLIIFDGSGKFISPESVNGISDFGSDDLDRVFQVLEMEKGGFISASLLGQSSGRFAVSVLSHNASGWYLMIYDDLQQIFDPLTSSTLIIFIVSLLTIMIAAAFVVAASKRISEPIMNLTSVVSQFGRGATHLRYDSSHGGEVGILATEFNNMAVRLESFTTDLEDKIFERTRELNNRVEQLRIAQNQLVESEKMAALGGLVAGFAHEINTPIGVSVTAASYIQDASDRAREILESPEVSKSTLVKTLEQIVSASQMATSNLERASQMIQRFKQVAADQYFEEQRELDLHSFISEIEDTLKTILKPAGCSISTEIPMDTIVVTYPGVLWQILSNLARNSLHHGFSETPSEEPGLPNEIRLIYSSTPKYHALYFCDNGPGIPLEHVPKIFDPFFTTRRSRGNTGLGLHIVYNLVHQKLNGYFSYLTPSQRSNQSIVKLPAEGACFGIYLPVSPI